MSEEQRREKQSLLDAITTILSELPWAKLLISAGKLVSNMARARRGPGMYEVLEYESVLRLSDGTGRKATFKKREKVRYLQDHIIAYQDQAWGDGEILLNYRCTPGKAVDRYRLGHKTYILISRPELGFEGASLSHCVVPFAGPIVPEPTALSSTRVKRVDEICRDPGTQVRPLVGLQKATRAIDCAEAIPVSLAHPGHGTRDTFSRKRT